MLDASGDVVGTCVGVGGGEVHVKGARRAVEGVEWVHACNLTGVRIHAPCRLTRLDVTPNYTQSAVLTDCSRGRRLTHGCHVSLVIHEASIEVRCIVARRAGDESASTAERILEEVEHGEELHLVNNHPVDQKTDTTYLARRHKHVVTEPTSNDGIVHDWLIGLVLEVTVPAGTELRARPAIHLIELLFGRADLDTGIDTVGCEWTCTVDVPLVEDLLLSLLISTDKVVEALDVRLSSVGGEGQVVVLEVQTNTGQVDQGLDASLAKLLGVTNTRALENEWRAQGASGHDDLLASLVDSGVLLAWRQRLGRADLDTDSSVALEDDLLALGVDNKVQVLVVCTSAVDVSVGRV